MVSWYRIRGSGIGKRLEAAWIAIIAAVIGVIGVVAGGFLTLIGGRFQSQDADRRLKTQLEHEAIQRREDQILAVQLESVENLRKFIDTASLAMPELGVVIGIVGDELFTRVMQDQQRALSSMLALQEQGAYDNVWNLVTIMKELANARAPESQGKLIQPMTVALGTLGSRYNELKKKAILAGRPE